MSRVITAGPQRSTQAHVPDPPYSPLSDTDTVFFLDASRYDPEQYCFHNVSPAGTTAPALAGSSHGPVFSTDQYGDYMFFPAQGSGGQEMTMTFPSSLTDANHFTVEGRYQSARNGNGQNLFYGSASSDWYLRYNDAETLRLWANGSTLTSASTVATLLSQDASDPFYYRVTINDTSADVWLSVDGETWVSAISTTFTTAFNPQGESHDMGSYSAATAGANGKFYYYRGYDGDATGDVIFEWLPTMFPEGARHFSTVADAYGNSWVYKTQGSPCALHNPSGETPGVKFTGTAGNYLKRPDTAANSIAGTTLSIGVCVTVADLTPAALDVWMGKWVESTSRAFLLYLGTDGTLRLSYSTDGSASAAATSTASTTTIASNGDTLWFYAFASTAGTDFYYSTDSPSTAVADVSWTQLGTTAGGAVSWVDVSAPIEIGAYNNGATLPSSDVIHRGFLYDGTIAAGTLVESFDASNVTAENFYNDNVADGWEVTRTDDRVDSNNPVVLLPKSDPYFYWPSVSGNYFSTPDIAGNSMTGQIDIQAKIKLPTLTPAASVSIVSKWLAAPNRGWVFQITSANTLRFLYSTTGSNSATKNSGVLSTRYSDGDEFWVRFTCDSALPEYKFYTSDDGESWVQFGGTVASAVDWTDVAADIEVGGNTSGTNELLDAGSVVRNVRVYDDYDGAGSLVANFDVADAADSADTWTASTTGETWTINRSTSGFPISLVGDYGKILFGGSHYLLVPNHPDLDYDASESLSALVQSKVSTHTAAGGRIISKEAAGLTGWTLFRYTTTEFISGRVDDGSTGIDVGETENAITYGTPAVAGLVWANADQETYIDGTSKDTASQAYASDAGSGGDMYLGGNPLIPKPLSQSEITRVTVVVSRLTDKEVSDISNQWAAKGTI